MFVQLNLLLLVLFALGNKLVVVMFVQVKPLVLLMFRKVNLYMHETIIRAGITCKKIIL